MLIIDDSTTFGWRVSVILHTSTINCQNHMLFRWFKFTLKHHAWQITIGHLGHFLLDFLVKFGHKGPWDIS